MYVCMYACMYVCMYLHLFDPVYLCSISVCMCTVYCSVLQGVTGCCSVLQQQCVAVCNTLHHWTPSICAASRYVCVLYIYKCKYEYVYIFLHVYDTCDTDTCTYVYMCICIYLTPFISAASRYVCVLDVYKCKYEYVYICMLVYDTCTYAYSCMFVSTFIGPHLFVQHLGMDAYCIYIHVNMNMHTFVCTGMIRVYMHIRVCMYLYLLDPIYLCSILVCMRTGYIYM